MKWILILFLALPAFSATMVPVSDGQASFYWTNKPAIDAGAFSGLNSLPLAATNDVRSLLQTNAANQFGGVGSGLTSLNASNVSGSFPLARTFGPTTNATINGLNIGVSAPTFPTPFYAVTNNGLVWWTCPTNNNPANVAGLNGSLCTTTNGQLYIRTNNLWVLIK